MRNRASAAFVALGLIWGSNFVFMKWASETIAPGQITLLDVGDGAAVLLILIGVVVLRRKPVRPAVPPPSATDAGVRSTVVRSLTLLTGNHNIA
jgi:drug/metabolite transporter (DMT)-like permease